MTVINIIFIIVGAFLTLLGFLIYKNNMVEMLAGYDKKKVIDKEGLAKWAGSNLILMGVTIVVISIIGLILSYNTTIFFILTVIGISVRIVIGTRKFERNNNKNQ